jgi:hypothetical protein
MGSVLARVARHARCSLGASAMTLRIDTMIDGHVATLRLSGRINSGDLQDVREEIAGRRGVIVLDLDEVMLVDVEAVRFLKAAEREGVVLRNCPAFIREWVTRE